MKNIINYLYEQSPKGRNKKKFAIDAVLLRKKRDFIKDRLFGLTEVMSAFTEAFDEGEYFEKKLRDISERAYSKNDYKKDKKETSNSSIADDEDKYILIFKLLLNIDYEPPLDNLILLQWHLRTVWLFYYLIEAMPEIPIETLLKIDLAALKIIYATGLAIKEIHESGVGKDSKKNRLHKSGEAQTQKKMRRSNIIKDVYIKYLNENADRREVLKHMSREKIAKEIQKRLSNNTMFKSDDPPSTKLIGQVMEDHHNTSGSLRPWKTKSNLYPEIGK